VFVFYCVMAFMAVIFPEKPGIVQYDRIIPEMETSWGGFIIVMGSHSVHREMTPVNEEAASFSLFSFFAVQKS